MARNGKKPAKAESDSEKPEKGKPGPKPAMTPELQAEYVARLEAGELHADICLSPHMPGSSSIYRAQEADPEGFGKQCMRAREIAMWGEHDELVRMEREVRSGVLAPDAHRAIASTKTWRMKCLSKSVFGDKVQTEVTGKDGGPIQTKSLDDDALKARIAALVTKNPALAAVLKGGG